MIWEYGSAKDPRENGSNLVESVNGGAGRAPIPFISPLAFEVECKFSPWSNPCHRERRSPSLFEKPGNSNPPADRWSQRVGWCRRLWKGCWGLTSSNVPRRSCKLPPCIRWPTRSRCTSATLASSRAEPTKSCGPSSCVFLALQGVRQIILQSLNHYGAWNARVADLITLNSKGIHQVNKNRIIKKYFKSWNSWNK